ncbi:hypothetical protein NDU88_000769 [Pleurodeles waltl]|uniref:CMP/dCMP-type deaminase domain-containing protein n=1 Tax=Pleurodeles waltl TaxID=8319 RepID=A0AAV7P1V1_PLEWA|nr:hypothetical protein NDU88_000769 [Pleurodeles waltl]
MAEEAVLMRSKINPEEFISVFDPRVGRKETYLLFEIQWNFKGRFYRGCCRNSNDSHAEVNFIENIFKTKIQNNSKKCWMTWYMSWSPCGICAKAITSFLAEYTNVTLEIRMARLFRHTDYRNKAGLKALHGSPAYIYIMAEQDYRYCWRTFVNYQQRDFMLWPYTTFMMLYFIHHLLVILEELSILGWVLPPYLPLTSATPSDHHQLLDKKFWRKQ